MNGAECLVGTLVNQGVDLVFTNPGTSEVGLVAEIAAKKQIRAVPVLFEGIAAGAADGYYRMTGRPAATMLHVGPGLANAWSALHNATKAGSGIINIVGQLSAAHLVYDSPLKSDVVALASSVSDVVCYPTSSAQVGVDACAISEAAKRGKIATLLMANDVGWSDGANYAGIPIQEDVTEQVVLSATAMHALMEGPRTLLLLGGRALGAVAQQEAAAIAKATGCSVMIEWANVRCERGGDLPNFDRIPYQVEDAVQSLADYDNIVLCGATEPIAFFNYRNSPSRLAAAGARILELQARKGDAETALREARREFVSGVRLPPSGSTVSPNPAFIAGPQSWDLIGNLIAAKLPSGAVVVNESITSVSGLFAASATAARHTWLENVGGSIGFGLPVSIGAAIASPGRRVLALCGDGSTMYSLQALWTIAREHLDITVLVFANNAYKVLIDELLRTSGGYLDERAQSLLQLDNPSISWTALSGSMGVASTRVTSFRELERALVSAIGSRGPNVIEVAVEVLH